LAWPRFAPVACAGRCWRPSSRRFDRPWDSRSARWWPSSPAPRCRPKLTILNNLAHKVDRLIVGGGIANTFLMAEGFPIGKSLSRRTWCPNGRKVLKTLADKGATLPLPIDRGGCD